MSEPTTALTLEEIEAVRRLHPGGECDHTYGGCREAQWIATLDAARSAASPPLLDTSYHRRRVARRRATPTPPDEDTLANALYVACVQPELTWWDDLPPDAQEAWRRAARTALEFR